jgi:GTP-binding protein
VSRHRRPQVVLVGRPNVGKSTLFNRLTGVRHSIVTAVPGTTRDVITHPAEWRGTRFDLTDTGGLFGASEDPLHLLVVERGHRALKTADLIVFVADGREGMVSGDEEIAAAVRSSGAPTVMAINKTDDRRAKDGALELYRLGFEPVIEISAEHGRGIGDLLDAVVEKLPRVTTETHEGADADEHAVDPGSRETAIAIVGRPNAGKSSLVNALLREERMIVSPVPGTTRDSVDSILTWHRRQFRIVDTAGIRKPGRVAQSGQVEALSVMLARRAIERADIVVLVLDATVGPTDQDAAIAGAAQDAGRGIIVVANKWDLMKFHGPEGAKIFDRTVRDHLKFLDYAPILHVSAETGERTGKLLETVDRVTAASRMRVPTGELNRFLRDLTIASPPVTESKRRHVRVLYAAQPTVAPPTFVLFTNVAAKMHFSYMRFLENRLREKYEFFGTPIRIVIRGRAPRSAESRLSAKSSRVPRKTDAKPRPKRETNARPKRETKPRPKRRDR